MIEITKDPEVAQRHEAARQAERLAVALEKLSMRIRSTAESFERSTRSTSAIAADLVCDYVQGTGGVGPILWALIDDLSRKP